MSGLRVVSGLGQGGYGCVVQVVHEETDGMFAMKSISKARLTRSRDRRRLALELKLMTEIPKSPFLNTCQAAFETTSEIFFVLDLVSGGDLFYHLAQRFNMTNSGFTEGEARVILAELVCGLQHLHEAGFIHRDIKVENVMLDSSGHVKVVDFGLACELQGEECPMSPMGSLIYMAPELLVERVGGRHTDWWAVGILAYELITGRSPWSTFRTRRSSSVRFRAHA